jgi:hypothetical protein
VYKKACRNPLAAPAKSGQEVHKEDGKAIRQLLASSAFITGRWSVRRGVGRPRTLPYDQLRTTGQCAWPKLKQVPLI